MRPDRYSADIIVVGAGAAGLAAAVTAAEAGLDCLVLEQTSQVGGTTAWAVGSICVCVDSVADFLADTEQYLTPQQADTVPIELRQLIAEHSAPTQRWLADLGVPFTGPYHEPPHRVPRLFATTPDGRAYVWWLLRRAIELGVRVRYQSRVSELLYTAGAVTGVRVDNESLTARLGTVLTTGDFAGNVELRTRYLSPAAAQAKAVNPTAHGDGLMLGRSVGAAWRNMTISFAPQLRFDPAPVTEDPWSADIFVEAAEAAAAAEPVRCRAVGHRAMQRAHMAPAAKGAAIVLDDGRLVPVAGAVGAVAATASRTAHLLLDSRWMPDGPWADLWISSAPTIGFATLADYLAARPDLVRLNADPAQLGVTAAALAQFGTWQPPFVLVGPARPVVTVTEGGLRVDTSLRVLNQEGQPIPGLFAAGATGQGGLLLLGHGLHLMWALVSGRVAARSVAATSGAMTEGGRALA
jgi:fumarate reductase flavoprotein subunit